MAGAIRRSHSLAVANHCGNADQNDGSIDGRLGRATQIAKPEDRLAIEDDVPSVPSHRGFAIRETNAKGGHVTGAILDAIGRTMAEILGAGDDVLGQSQKALTLPLRKTRSLRQTRSSARATADLTKQLEQQQE